MFLLFFFLAIISNTTVTILNSSLGYVAKNIIFSSKLMGINKDFDTTSVRID